MLRLNKKVWSNLRILLIIWERNYRFHNPNSAEDTADFLCKLLIEVNAVKVEMAIEKTAFYAESGDYILENLSENREKLFVG